MKNTVVRTINANKNWDVEVHDVSEYTTEYLKFSIVSLIDGSITDVMFYPETRYIVYPTEDREPVKPVRDAIRGYLLTIGYKIKKTFYTMSIDNELAGLYKLLGVLESKKASNKFYGNDLTIAQSRYDYLTSFSGIYKQYSPAHFDLVTEYYDYVMDYVRNK